MQQLPLAVHRDDDATFANFQVSDDNPLLLQQLQGTLAQQGDAMVYLHGPAGSGRSHLLQAVCHQADGKGQSAVYLPLAELAPFAPDQVLQGLAQVSLLCLDDLDAIAQSGVWQEQLFHLYNSARQSGQAWVISASAPPAMLGLTLADLCSRLQHMLLLRVMPLDDSGKARALQLRAKALGLQLDNHVAEFILRRHARDMAALVACLQRLDKASIAAKRKLTLPFVSQVLT